MTDVGSDNLSRSDDAPRGAAGAMSDSPHYDAAPTGPAAFESALSDIERDAQAKLGGSRADAAALPFRVATADELLEEMVLTLRDAGYSVEPPFPVSAEALRLVTSLPATAHRLSDQDAFALRRAPHNLDIHVCRCDSWFVRPAGTMMTRCDVCWREESS